ncbi:unnamed protein product [Microthlaspi erraticum]|uniref:Reverse transcriptase zinc-binding domain-containing protein n=1 Tax=Microthlaspi erraticum TaxID=1685480 RepID=A0A6D2KDZ8_9BRAS|nr:unnamed protein product [Microthlaspi erraticum]
MWNLPLLKQLFDVKDVALILILGIPTSHVSRPDSMGWFLTRTGRYSVKSGYGLEQQTRQESTPLVFGPDTRSLQAQVWKVKCTQKLQHFLWQSLTGCIAVGDRLKSRDIQIDPQCLRCGMTAETVNHTLFECPPALQVWALSPIPTVPNRFPTGSLFANMAHLFSELPNDERMGCYPWLLWYIWKARNDKVLGNVDWDPYDIITKATAEALAWANAKEKQETGITRVVHSVEAISSGVKWMGHGRKQIVGLDWAGNITPPNRIGGSDLGHAMYVKNNKVEMVFETDCSDVVKMVSTPEEWPAFAVLLDEVDRSRTRFTSFSIVHIPRTNNTKADKLARSARTLPTDVYYVNSVSPAWIPELF